MLAMRSIRLAVSTASITSQNIVLLQDRDAVNKLGLGSDTLGRHVLHVVVLADPLILLWKLLRDSQRIAPRDEPTCRLTKEQTQLGDFG
uniref:Uncharacterized protein n=1 Tax=Arundo donax TaxID=35708 RepID=A0A0A9CYR3_ARUDO